MKKRLGMLFFVVCGFMAVQVFLSEMGLRDGEVTEYAIIVNGKADFFQKKDGLELHAKNIVQAFEKLKEIGYKEENIFVLSYNDPRTNKNNPNNFRPGSFEAYKEIVNKLKRTISKKSSLLIYTTGHGGRYANNNPAHSELIFDDKFISAEEFVALTLKIPFGKLIYVGDQCYSGGFIKTFETQGKRERRNIVAVSDIDHLNNTVCESFSKGFWESLGDLRYDLNGDNFVSVEEAFHEGSRKIKIEMKDRPEKANPQYISTGACGKKQNKFLHE